jgi:hypothetical protein
MGALAVETRFGGGSIEAGRAISDALKNSAFSSNVNITCKGGDGAKIKNSDEWRKCLVPGNVRVIIVDEMVSILEYLPKET